jgi:hypothetical protein
MDAMLSKRRWLLCSLVVASIALLPGCGDGLQEYVSKEGRLRVLMPGTPEVDNDPTLPSVIKKRTLLQRSGSYAVAWEDLAPDNKHSADQRLDRACDAAVKHLKGRTITRKEIELTGGYPGRELIVEWDNQQGIVHDRMYLVEDRLYHVMASGPKWWVESAISRKVLDSFALFHQQE